MRQSKIKILSDFSEFNGLFSIAVFATQRIFTFIVSKNDDSPSNLPIPYAKDVTFGDGEKVQKGILPIP